LAIVQHYHDSEQKHILAQVREIPPDCDQIKMAIYQ